MMSESTQDNKPTPMTEIETCVLRLLQTTKRLLATLTGWSAGEVSSTKVYEEYGTLEIHFIKATQAFESASLSMKDMIYLPYDLFNCLKKALSNDPSTMEHYLPAIREIIVRLVQGLKEKQRLIRERLDEGSTKEQVQEPTEKVDMDDPTTQDAVNALTMQENLANTSSVRKTKKDIIPLYIKKGPRIKKVNVDLIIQMTALQELFRDKLSCGDTPLTIYILDPESNIEYELEDINDIKPYSILSVHDDESMLSTEMHCLFKKTLNQVLQSVQAQQETTSTTPTTAENHNHNKLQEEIEELRHDLQSMNKIYQDLKSSTERVITELRQKKKPLHTVVMLDPTTTTTTTRAEMNASRQVTQRAATHITNRLEILQDTIDQIKLDVTQNRCRPSRAQLEHCQSESEQIQKDIQVLVDHLKSVKPSWKRTWEIELQQIVKEQQFLKEQEALVVDLKEDHQALFQVLDQLNKIAEIQQRKKEAGITTTVYKLSHSVPDGFQGMKSVIKQVSTIEVDHSKRVQALDEAERARSKALSQRIDAFEKELTDFVGFNKLKKTGGPEAIERQRQEKDQDLIKQIFVHPSHYSQEHYHEQQQQQQQQQQEQEKEQQQEHVKSDDDVLTDETQTLPPVSLF
ncbi:actin interacting protein 3-domain-containing protein [Pilaira anomala]|nr:actin interacting protein 3-domain-containing protein [Pilaira anomala]